MDRKPQLKNGYWVEEKWIHPEANYIRFETPIHMWLVAPRIELRTTGASEETYIDVDVSIDRRKGKYFETIAHITFAHITVSPWSEFLIYLGCPKIDERGTFGELTWPLPIMPVPPGHSVGILLENEEHPFKLRYAKVVWADPRLFMPRDPNEDFIELVEPAQLGTQTR